MTDVFLVMFSVVSPASFENVKAKWKDEVQHHCPGIPVVLVGTKTDLRNDPEVMATLKDRGLAMKTFEDGENLAKEFGATYRECSALTQEGLLDVFETAVRVTKAKPNNGSKNKKDKKSCTLL